MHKLADKTNSLATPHGPELEDLSVETTLRLERESFHVLGVRSSGIDDLWGTVTPDAEVDNVPKAESLASKLNRLSTSGNHRFVDGKVVSSGSSSTVHVTRDENCGRNVVVKKLPLSLETERDKERFIREAKIVASLEHPAIVPIYDVDVDDAGQTFIVMRKVEGDSLKEYIARRQAGESVKWIADEADLVRVFKKACDALSFAHSKGVIHQDLKPANIMLGPYGQVFVIDWGASADAADEISMTPAYMSPEQAIGSAPSPLDDVYCLGATLFHCLTLRLPSAGDDLEALWEKRRRGEIRWFNGRERTSIPAPLAAIVAKAMAPDPRDRYQSIEEFGDDLKAFLAGEVVVAHEDSLIDYLGRWYRRHVHAFWTTLIVAVLLGAAVVAIFNTILKERAYWGEPVMVDDFESYNADVRWIGLKDEFKVMDGELVSTGKGAHYFIYDRRFDGSVAIEFDARWLPDAPPGDLSVVWCRNLVRRKNNREMEDFYHMQVGAYSNSLAGIFEDGRIGRSYADFQLESNRTYRIRAEVDGHRIEIFVDGESICRYDSLFPFGSGYIGLYGFYQKKAFDNVEIFAKPLPPRVTAMTVADSFFTHGQYGDAIDQYRILSSSFADEDTGIEARYKIGLAYERLGRKDEAYAIWDKMRESRFADEIAVRFLYRSFLEENPDAALRVWDDLYATAEPRRRRLLEQTWQSMVERAMEDKNEEQVKRLVELKEQHFPSVRFMDFILSRAFGLLGRHEEILERFPEQDYSCGQALFVLGRYDEVVRNYSYIDWLTIKALYKQERYEELVRRYPDSSKLQVIDAMHRLGRYEQILRNLPLNDSRAIKAAKALRREEEIIQKAARPEDCASALIRLGRFEEAIVRFPKHTFICADVLLRQGRYELAYERCAQGIMGVRAKLAMGRYDEARSVPGLERSDVDYFSYLHAARFDEARKAAKAPKSVAEVFLAQGKLEMARETSIDTDIQQQILRYKGDYEAALQHAETDQQKAMALLALRRFDELKKRYLFLDEILHRVTVNEDLDLLVSGEKAYNQTVFAEGANPVIDFTDVTTRDGHLFVRPFIQHLHGDEGAFSLYRHIISKLRHAFAERSWHRAAYVLGRIDNEAFLKQPRRLNAATDLLLCKAMRLETEKKTRLAAAQYKQYLNEPVWRREEQYLLEAFARWRLRELEGTDE